MRARPGYADLFLTSLEGRESSPAATKKLFEAKPVVNGTTAQ